jgi:GMP reductase
MNALDYKDVHLIPRYSTLASRSEADTSVRFGGSLFKIPVIPANMQSVVDLGRYGVYLGAGLLPIMHRFEPDDTEALVRYPADLRESITSISVGVNQDSVDMLKRFASFACKIHYITIDVAHGDHIKVRNMIWKIREIYPDTFIIAGNVTTPGAVKNLELWGANAVKVGIGGGLACTTRHMTGFHVPMFTAVQECAKHTSLPIVADGGIRHPGDIAKALVAGATMVMVGSMFAACSDSPAATVNGRKVYYGSASFEAKKQNRHIEGILLELESSVTIAERVNELQQALQSSISYAGGKDLSCFKHVQYATSIPSQYINE